MKTLCYQIYDMSPNGFDAELLSSHVESIVSFLYLIGDGYKSLSEAKAACERYHSSVIGLTGMLRWEEAPVRCARWQAAAWDDRTEK